MHQRDSSKTDRWYLVPPPYVCSKTIESLSRKFSFLCVCPTRLPYPRSPPLYSQLLRLSICVSVKTRIVKLRDVAKHKSITTFTCHIRCWPLFYSNFRGAEAVQSWKQQRVCSRRPFLKTRKHEHRDVCISTFLSRNQDKLHSIYFCEASDFFVDLRITRNQWTCNWKLLLYYFTNVG